MDGYEPAHERSSFSVPSSTAPFRLDEGFAEDSQAQGEDARTMFASTAASFQAWVMSQNEEARSEIAYEILRTLRTSNIAAVVEKLTPLLHMDPIEKLPPEIISQIFSYLDASTLLTASLASQTWRERILDPRLWQQLYKSQGWGVDAKAVAAFEDEYEEMVRSGFSKGKGKIRGGDAVKGQPHLKRRATSDWLDSTPRKVSADVTQWKEQHGIIEADPDTPMETEDQEMLDAVNITQDSPSRRNKKHSHDSSDEMDFRIQNSPPTQRTMDDMMSETRSRLLVEDPSGTAKINWSYLYQQRHRLEENWHKGRFTNFQLPHPQYPQEAHTECVYTIQFYGNWLVSGSRDKTLRIWDLETRRLRRKPLTGHSQSVLCLQFDPTEGEDVIISGSSDSSIIVWKFSTGQKMHVIQSAHEESVLNLRFDHRYLVTCSKDKKIKVWNRKTLSALDPDYPSVKEGSPARVPSYIIDISATDISLLEARIADGIIKTLKPYTHIMTFEGHSAAVNAIQIHGDVVVSASGDRMIRMWNVKTGLSIRTVPGHQKGIACVQYDSKRIVSGSSDNTVRIYDSNTAAEVAVLLGHSNLVRTVQAGFGDIPGSLEEDFAGAKAAEDKHRTDMVTGTIVEDRHYARRLRHGLLGTSRTAIGSRLPPGGGGSKWARIVSGSYDESIIIWKKDTNGQWIVGQTLRQEAAVRASQEPDRVQTRRGLRVSDQLMSTQSIIPNRQHQQQAVGHGPAGPHAPNTVANNNVPIVPVMSASQIVQHAMNASMAGLQNGIQNVMGLTRTLNMNVNITSNSTTGAPAIPGQALNGLGPALQSAVNQATSQVHAMTQNALYQAAATNQIQAPGNTQTNAPAGGSNQQLNGPAGQPQAGVPSTPSGMLIAPGPAPAAPAPVPNPAAAQPNQSVSRVFKLQFDARRIVCCSQDSRIIGWDFANSDPELIESCRFFLGP